AGDCYEQRRYDDALAGYEASEQIARELNDAPAIQAVLGNKGRTLSALGRDADALAAHEERERICTAIKNPAGRKMALMNQILVVERTTDYARVPRAFDELEKVCTSEGDKALLGETLTRRTKWLDQAAQLASNRHDWQAAVDFHTDKARVSEILNAPVP